MRYFSGFCLQNEYKLFDFWLKNSNNYTVAGFSYGAIKAVEYALSSKKRIDKLILLSPAFFNEKDEKFKKLQLLSFSKDKTKYVKNFLNNALNGTKIEISNFFKMGTKEELKELLYYRWQKEKLKELQNRGITIEVVIGENDLIVSSIAVKEFFEKVAIVYFIKRANHFLQIGEK